MIALSTLLGIPVPGLFAQVEMLTLEETLHRVVQNNLQIESEHTRLDAAEAERKAEYGAFEPRLQASWRKNSVRRLNNRQEALSQLGGLSELASGLARHYQARDDRISVGLETLLPTGGELRLGTDWSILRNNLQDSLGTPLDQEHESYAGVSLRQPLLKGAGFGVTLARLRIATSRSEQTRHEVRRRLMSILSQAEIAYWELYRTQEELDYRRQSVSRAEQLLSDNRARLEAGRMSSIDVKQAQAALALRETQLSEAEQTLADAAAQLRSYLGDSSAEYEAAAYHPLDTLEFEPETLDYAASIRSALAYHPTILSLEKALGQSQIQRKVAGNYRLPRVDFTAGIGVNGLAEEADTSYEVMRRANYPSWYVGLEFEVPIFTGIRERQELIAAQHRLRGAQADLDATRIELSNLMRAAVNSVRSLASQVEQYGTVVELSEAVLEAELSNLDNGRADSRDVLRAEEELTEARIALLRSLVNYRRRLIDKRVLEGVYLLEHKMDLLDEDAS